VAIAGIVAECRPGSATADMMLCCCAMKSELIIPKSIWLLVECRLGKERWMNLCLL
jgi:hypothetical protein